MHHDDLVSAALREAEKEVDKFYLSNPLVSKPFAEAAWYFLAFCEEIVIRQFVQATAASVPPSAHEQTALADNVMMHAKWPLRWLLGSCAPGGTPPQGHNGDMYNASWQLSGLALNYLQFESAFTYASIGLLKLSLKGHRIVPSDTMRADSRFEAYDRLAGVNEKEITPPVVATLVERVRSSVRVKKDWFYYDLNPRLVKESLECAGAYLESRFRLPEDWALPRYTTGEFSHIAKVLWVLALIHFSARVIATMQGCVGLGYSRSLIVMGRVEFERRLARYSGVGAQPVRAIIEDLTYGTRGIHYPDPALQPLIPLTPTVFGIAPNLVINNSLERNLMVLLNRLPEERGAYSKLSAYKEELLRGRIIEALSGLAWRFWHGPISRWKDELDLDLAIISDSERRCLLLELKSFLAPAEPREIRDRSEEIARGIDQVRIRRSLSASQPKPLCEALKIEDDYVLLWAVASETSIGGAWVQADDVPVVRASHLVRKLVASANLTEPSAWLAERRYLPREGQHYRLVDQDVTVGPWTLEWYGIAALGEAFI